jgi:DHA3 family tetracycline resistance protein-like MFS transporter
LIEGSLPFSWSVALAQVVWGFGYTFTSGATEARIADEVGGDRAGGVFLRDSQAAGAGSLIAIPLGILLGTVRVALPILAAGGLLIVLAIFLSLVMTEHGFGPAEVRSMPSARSLEGRLSGSWATARSAPPWSPVQ